MERMTIENVITQMRRLAWEIGGNHHSLQEAEQLLLDLADQLGEININMSIKLNDALKEVDDQYTGVSKEYRFLTKRQKNIEELANRNKDQEAAEGVQNIVVTECMTNAEVFTKIYGYQPATDSVVCNKGDWCGHSEPCKYCSCVGDAIGREEDWWNSPYKRDAADENGLDII